MAVKFSVLVEGEEEAVELDQTTPKDEETAR